MHIKDIVGFYLQEEFQGTFLEAINIATKQNQETFQHKNRIPIAAALRLQSSFKTRWAECFRNKARFMKRFADWLNREIQLTETDFEVLPNEGETLQENVASCCYSNGRPKKEFTEGSTRSKRRKTEAIREEYSTEALAFATQMKFRKDGNLKAANILKEITEQNATAAGQHNIGDSNRVKEIPFSPIEALSLIVNTKMSKSNYTLIRNLHKSKNCTLYPPYRRILEAKLECYPEAVRYTEFSARVPLQCLLDHTAKRLLLSNKTAIDTINENNTDGKIALQLLTKCGMDGSGCQNIYNMKYDQHSYPGISESNMFSTFISPVLLALKTNGKIVWQSDSPSSGVYCRPLSLQFMKENPLLVKREWSFVNEQIEAILPTEVENVTIHHKVIMTMIDGKICQVVTGTPSASTCYICKAKPTEMNNLNAIADKHINYESLSFGLSPLHLLINTMECILHIAYRMPLKIWAVKGPINKEIMLKEKKRIQEELKKQMGINVDIPTQGSGSSNNGNTARKFFANPSLVSSITGVNEDLIKRFAVILTAINSNYQVNVRKFRVYARETAELYINLYPWYCMPVSVHKMLIHGAQIIENLCIPVGQASEEGSEVKHKDIRFHRLHHTCKISRYRSTEDLMKYMLVASDPVISSLQKQKHHKKKCTLSSEVLALLEPSHIYFSDAINQSVHSSESSDKENDSEGDSGSGSDSNGW